MTTLTHNNHVVYGYGDKAFGHRERLSDRYWIRFGQCQRTPLSFREECVQTARLIGERPSIILALSGGLDSQVVGLSLLAAGVPFECASMRYVDSNKNLVLNQHDLDPAIQFVRQYGLTHRILDVDIATFFTSGPGFEYAKKCFTNSFVTTAMAWFLAQLDGFVILGAGEAYLYNPRAFPGDHWVFTEVEYTGEWMRGFLNTGRDGCVGFYYYTPEIMMSFFHSPEYRQRMRGQTSDYDSLPAKYQMYNNAFGPLEIRGALTGCEYFDWDWWAGISFELSRQQVPQPCSGNYRLGATYEISTIEQAMLPQLKFAAREL